MGLFSNQHHQLSYSSVLLIRIHSIDLKNQQKSTLLTRQCSPKKRDNASRVFSLGFVMVGRSFLLISIEKGQSIFSAALVGGYSILVCCFQIYKIACCSAIAIFSIPFSCYFINISAQFKSEYVSNNSYIFAVCSRLSPMFVTPALHT